VCGWRSELIVNLSQSQSADDQNKREDEAEYLSLSKYSIGKV
jgi:hypothetical protein